MKNNEEKLTEKTQKIVGKPKAIPKTEQQQKDESNKHQVLKTPEVQYYEVMIFSGLLNALLHHNNGSNPQVTGTGGLPQALQVDNLGQSRQRLQVQTPDTQLNQSGQDSVGRSDVLNGISFGHAGFPGGQLPETFNKLDRPPQLYPVYADGILQGLQDSTSGKFYPSQAKNGDLPPADVELFPTQHHFAPPAILPTARFTTPPKAPINFF